MRIDRLTALQILIFIFYFLFYFIFIIIFWCGYFVREFGIFFGESVDNFLLFFLFGYCAHIDFVHFFLVF